MESHTGPSSRLFAVTLAVLATAATPDRPLAQEGAAPFEITGETVDAEARVALAAVEESRGVELSGWLTVRVATREELTELLEPIFQADLQTGLQPDADVPESVSIQARSMAKSFGFSIQARFFHEERAVLVIPENISQQVSLFSESVSAEYLRALLVHEVMHAADDRTFGWSSRSKGTGEKIEAFRAVVEGHAQYWARRICEERGWTTGFAAFTRMIGRTPDIENMLVRQFLRSVGAGIATAYHDGEVFIEHLLREGGEEAVARAFREPPAELDIIFNPEWFLHPDQRPVLTLDFEGALGWMIERYDPEVWGWVSGQVIRPQLEEALSLLSEEEREAVLGSLRHNRYASLFPTEDPSSKSVQGVLLEFETPKDATFYVAVGERISRMKDEQMKGEGPFRLREAVYQVVDSGACRGFQARKTLRVYTHQDVLVHTCAVARGRVVVELTTSNVEVEGGEVRQSVLELAERSVVPVTPAEDAAPEEEAPSSKPER